MRSLKERFEAKVCPEPNTGCHLWTGSSEKDGYGAVYIDNGKTKRLAHRISWSLANGDIPKGLFVCHTCDTPACVNPDHLFLGTHSENMQDMIAKGRGRQPKGEEHPRCKVSDLFVAYARFLCDQGMYQKDIAAIFGVNTCTVSWWNTRSSR